MNLKLSLLGAVIGFSLASGAHAAQIALSPSSVVGTSGYYTACCNFPAGAIFDQQSGAVTETFGAGYWLNPDNGPADAFIAFDLGQTYNLSDVVLYNTHNGGYADRGTGNFKIYGSNSITDFGSAGNFHLVGGSVVASGTLAAESTGTPAAQSFTSSGSFRYLSFNPTSVSVGGTSCCGINNYGLDELKAFGSAVPEPTSWALMISGFGMAGAVLRRRRAVATTA